MDPKMDDIRRCLSDMREVIKITCANRPMSSLDRDVRRFLGTLSTSSSELHSYWVEVGFSWDGRPFVRICIKDDPKDPNEVWFPEEIDLVHRNFDVITEVCEDFCSEEGQEPIFRKVRATLYA